MYEAITRDKDHRGPVVAAGGVRTLINLGNNGNDECKKRAQQSLARIAITMDPNIAFSGQRACDAVRPILALLEYDKTGMETFEGVDDAMCHYGRKWEKTQNSHLINHYPTSEGVSEVSERANK